jgi:Domain of unknown function (DUF222)
VAELAAELEGWPPRTWTAWPTPPWPTGSCGCGGWWIAWKATGSAKLAAVDARGAAGADQHTQAPSTASWLRARLRLGANAATSSVRTARALFRGHRTHTGQALANGDLSMAHASVLAAGTHDLPVHTTVEAEPVLVEAAQRLDPPRLRRVVAHLQRVADPEAAEATTERRHARRACGWPRPWRAWSRWMGCWSRRPARPWWPPRAPGPPAQRRRRA